MRQAFWQSISEKAFLRSVQGVIVDVWYSYSWRKICKTLSIMAVADASHMMKAVSYSKYGGGADGLKVVFQLLLVLRVLREETEFDEQFNWDCWTFVGCGAADSQTKERGAPGEGGGLQYQSYWLESPERCHEACSALQIPSCTRLAVLHTGST